MCNPELGILGAVILSEVLSSVVLSPLSPPLELELFIPLLHLFVHLMKRIVWSWCVAGGVLGAGPQHKGACPAFRVGSANVCLALLCEVPPPTRHDALREDTDHVSLQGSGLDISAHSRQHILGDVG